MDDMLKLPAAIWLVACLAGPVGASFEKGGLLVAGPRAGALGGAVSALADDVLTAHACPAGLVQSGGPALSGAWGSRGSGMSGFSVGTAGTVEGIGVMAQVRGWGQGSLSERTVALGAGFPVVELPGFSFGAAFKLLDADLEVDKAWGTGFDLGFMYRHALPWHSIEMSWAAAVEDAFGGVHWDSGLVEDLARQARLGVGARFPGGSRILVEGRLVSSVIGDERLFAAGAEQEIALLGVPVSFRAGWRDGSERAAEAGGGVGIRVWSVGLDYAFVQETAGGGETEHLLAVSWLFAPVEPSVSPSVRTGRAAPIAVIPSANEIMLETPYHTVDFLVKFPASERSSAWALVVIDASGEVVWSAEGEGHPPATIKWNGATVRGEPARAGTYSCSLLVRGPASWRRISREEAFRLKRRGDTVQVDLDSQAGGY